MAKNNQETNTNAGFETGIVESFDIDRVRRSSNGMIYFNLTLNGVKVNGCYLKEWKDGRQTKTFIGLPSYKGSDGNYYNHVYFRFSDEDQDAIIDKVYEAYEAAQEENKRRR